LYTFGISYWNHPRYHLRKQVLPVSGNPKTVTTMRSLLPLAALSVLLSLQSCADSKEREPIDILKEAAKKPDAKIGSENFRFDLPDGWQRIDTVIEGNRITFIVKNGQDEFRPTINVTNELMHNKPHVAYVRDSKAYFATNFTGVKFIDEGRFDISGKTCLWFSYNNRQSKIARDAIYYSIDNNGISCNITAAVMPGGLPKYKQTFDKIVQSFRIEN
jgi:hypothetical protein